MCDFKVCVSSTPAANVLYLQFTQFFLDTFIASKFLHITMANGQLTIWWCLLKAKILSKCHILLEKVMLQLH